MQFKAVLALFATASVVVAAPNGVTFPLEKRLTCSLPDGNTWCLANCYIQGFCDSYCTSKNICVCEGKKSNAPTCGKI